MGIQTTPEIAGVADASGIQPPLVFESTHDIAAEDRLAKIQDNQ